MGGGGEGREGSASIVVVVSSVDGVAWRGREMRDEDAEMG
jgi:hypothetical protein